MTGTNPNYEVTIPEIGAVKVRKKRGMKTVRLRVTSKGELVVSAPWYVSRQLIERFLYERQDWMRQHSRRLQTVYYDGMRFGHKMQLLLHSGKERNRSRIQASSLSVYLIKPYNSEDKDQQQFIEKKIIKAMHQEAEHLLLPKLLDISRQTDMPFNQAYIKNLTGRWGSCDQAKSISLSLFLVQLPQDLIDYVIIHELSHTKHLNHSPAFWGEVGRHCPEYKHLRKALKVHDPRIVERS